MSLHFWRFHTCDGGWRVYTWWTQELWSLENRKSHVLLPENLLNTHSLLSQLQTILYATHTQHAPLYILNQNTLLLAMQFCQHKYAFHGFIGSVIYTRN